MPVLDLRDGLTIVTGLVTIVSIFITMRVGMAKLELGQGEMLRQLKAVHARLDDYGKRITLAERDHAVLVERVANLRSSQRFRLKEEPPMFEDTPK